MAPPRRPRVPLTEQALFESELKYANPDIVSYYELDFNGDVIKPGDKIRIKNVRGIFQFYRWAHNIVLDKSWVDVVSEGHGSFHSYRIEQIKLVIRPKKSRARKVKSG